MRDVTACGELLIDFVATDAGISLAQAGTFRKAAGGAPANVAVGVARLGRSAGFLGQVGDDDFGHFLADTLNQHSVDTNRLHFSTEARTALAFVSLRLDGERDFMFYRHPSADMLWQAGDDDLRYAANTRVFHFGSISLIDSPSRESTLSACESAEQAGALISYDPNLRLPLWPSAEAARQGMLLGWMRANVIKVSEEEILFLTGRDDLENAVRSLWHPGLRLVTVSRGANGCRWFTPETSGNSPGFAVHAVDTTGAGDAFMAGLLTGLLDADLKWGESTLPSALRLANATGALTTTRPGAIPALPTRAEVDALLSADTRFGRPSCTGPAGA